MNTKTLDTDASGNLLRLTRRPLETQFMLMREERIRKGNAP